MVYFNIGTIRDENRSSFSRTPCEKPTSFLLVVHSFGGGSIPNSCYLELF